MGLLTTVTPSIERDFGSGFGRKVQKRSIRVEEWIDRRSALAFVLLTVLYAVVVVALSSVKLLWLDELITLHIARLGSAGAIWSALEQGVDPNPPITHLLVHFSRRIFGEGELALRLPAMAGYWIGLISLYAFLRRHLPGAWALSGTVLSMTMGAFEYSYESRSYGIFYGLCMAAILCWSRTADPARSAADRRWSLLGMTLALGAGIATNYFAVLALLPIAAGELTRSYRRASEAGCELLGAEVEGYNLLRFIDLRIWVALALGATPLFAFRAMIAHSIAQFAPYAWNKVSLDQVADSYLEMVEMMLYPILALFLLYGLIWMAGRLCYSCRTDVGPGWVGVVANEVRSTRGTIPAHEAVAVFFLMVYPFLGYLVASMHGGMLSPRFVIPVCFGFAMAGVFAAYRLFQNFPGSGAILLCFVGAWFIARESVVGYWYMEQKQSFYKVLDKIPEAEANLEPGSPIVIPDPLMALTFRHYAPPAMAARVVFPVDFPAIRMYRHDDSPEENLWAGRSWIYALPIVPLAAFQESAGKYLMIADKRNWLIEDLLHHGYPVQRLAIDARAEEIGGFTPLGRGTPGFYTSAGDLYLRSNSVAPIPFQLSKNLPTATLTPADGVLFEPKD